MDNKRAARLLIIAFLVGFIGDALLQAGVNHLGYDWGLSGYFTQHGNLESMFIAGGMIVGFYIPYLLSDAPLKIQYLGLYGLLLDLLFRYTRLFPSLDGYYSHFSILLSGIWGAIPMCLPIVIEKLIWPQTKII